MEFKIKILEKRIETMNSKMSLLKKTMDSEVFSLKKTHGEFITALDILQKMVEQDSIDIAKLLKLIDSRFTTTTIHDINEQLGVL